MIYELITRVITTWTAGLTLVAALALFSACSGGRSEGTH